MVVATCGGAMHMLVALISMVHYANNSIVCLIIHICVVGCCDVFYYEFVSC